MASVTIHVDFGAPKIKSLTASIFSPSISHEIMGLDAMISVFYSVSDSIILKQRLAPLSWVQLLLAFIIFSSWGSPTFTPSIHAF